MSQAGMMGFGGGGGIITSVVGGDNINVETVGSVATVNLNNFITWPITNSAGTEGVIYLGGESFMHAFGGANTFLGDSAGNFTLSTAENNVGIGSFALNTIDTASRCVAIGVDAQNQNTSGNDCVGIGYACQSGLESGTQNTAVGSMCQSGATITGVNNCAFGYQCMSGISSGQSNNSYGVLAGATISTGSNNCTYGQSSGQGISDANNNSIYGHGSFLNSNGSSNSAFGFASMAGNVSGDLNCAFGNGAYSANGATGTYNICIGVNSGTNYTSTENSNILIGAISGIPLDANVIRIGVQGSSVSQQNACYIAGITGSAVGATNAPVFVDSDGKLGTGSGSFGTTNHAVQVGNASGGLTSIPVGTTGQLLAGSTGNDPLFTSVSLGDFSFSSGTAGATRTLRVSNTDNTSGSSNAIMTVATGGSSSGDPVYQATTTATTWSWGIDNSVTSPSADPFVISQGAVLGTTNVMSVATTGAINYPLQPAFLAFQSTTTSNVTGDGTQYTIIADTEIYDQGSNYNNTTGVFTAPVSGRYHFCLTVFLTGLGAGHTSAQYRGNYSSLPYIVGEMNATAIAVGGNFSYGTSFYVNMVAGDTISCSITVSNSTKTVGVFGTSNPDTFFSGALVC